MPICISGLKRTSIYGQQKRGMIPYLFLLGYSDSNQEKQDHLTSSLKKPQYYNLLINNIL